MTRHLLADVRRRIPRGWIAAATVLGAVCAAAWPAPAAAQAPTVTPPPEQLPFTRPESWVLAHFDAATLLTGLPTPSPKPWSVAAGFEVGWLPPLDPTQRRVGFNGTEEEDLNKSPVLPRFRVTIGLPGRFSAIVAGTLPLTVFGLKATLLSLGLERPLIETPKWTVGLRGYGQIGSVEGDFTCPSSVLPFPPGSPGNTGGCEAASSDVSKLRYLGGEASVAYQPDGSRLSPHAAVGLSYMDVGFQVDALTFGFVDRTSYLSHGTVFSASGGVNYRVSSRFTLGVDAFYAPLWVRRAPGQPLQNDGLFNVRALLSYRLR
jgi:hypothetical protein